MPFSLIINADDFGLCQGVNQAVLKAHTDGILTSATIMTNFPHAQDAVKIAKDHPKLGTGLHINLLEGPALTKNPDSPLTDSQNNFKLTPASLVKTALLNIKAKKAIENEITAQLQWLLEKGIKPSHIDSHKHIHTFPLIYSIVNKIASKYQINAIRYPYEPARLLNSNIWPSVTPQDKKRAKTVSILARINRIQSSTFIKNQFLIGLAHTGKIDRTFLYTLADENFSGITELMTHPGYDTGLDIVKTRLIEERQIELKALTDPDIIRKFQLKNIKLINYTDV